MSKTRNIDIKEALCGLDVKKGELPRDKAHRDEIKAMLEKISPRQRGLLVIYLAAFYPVDPDSPVSPLDLALRAVSDEVTYGSFMTLLDMAKVVNVAVGIAPNPENEPDDDAEEEDDDGKLTFVHQGT